MSQNLSNSFKTYGGTYYLKNEFHLNSKNFQRSRDKPLPTIQTKLSYLEIKNKTENHKQDKEEEPKSEQFFLVNSSNSIFLCKYNTNDFPEKLMNSEPTLRFTAPPTSHDFNSITCQYPDKFEILIGFYTGDILLLQSPNLSNKQSSRYFNKDGCIGIGPVSNIKFQSANIFVVTFSNGNLYVCDKEKEDGPILRQPQIVGSNDIFHVVQQKNSKFNPISTWFISTNKINDICFSPDGKFLAVVCGNLIRTFEFFSEKLICDFSSYFGNILTCCWTPDNKYIITGGESDRIEIFSLTERHVVARSENVHFSWVSVVQCDQFSLLDSKYIIYSVGQDWLGNFQ